MADCIVVLGKLSRTEQYDDIDLLKALRYNGDCLYICCGLWGHKPRRVGIPSADCMRIVSGGVIINASTSE